MPAKTPESKGPIDLGLDFDSLTSLDNAPTATPFKLDVQTDLGSDYIAMPVLKGTDKGKLFYTVDKESTSVGTPSTTPSTSHYVDVVFNFIAPSKSRAFSLKAYDPSNPSGPDCYSKQGLYPAERSKSKQASSCSECPMAQWVDKTPPRCQEYREVIVTLIDSMDTAKFKISRASNRHGKVVKNYLANADFDSLLSKMQHAAASKGISPESGVVRISTVELPPGNPAIGLVYSFQVVRWVTPEEAAELKANAENDMDMWKQAVYAPDRRVIDVPEDSALEYDALDEEMPF